MRAVACGAQGFPSTPSRRNSCRLCPSTLNFRVVRRSGSLITARVSIFETAHRRRKSSAVASSPITPARLTGSTQRGHLARDVRGASEPMFGFPNAYHGYGRFRRDPLDCAHDVFVQHQVAYHPDMHSRIALENRQQGVDLSGVAAVAHGCARCCRRVSSVSAIAWMQRECTSWMRAVTVEGARMSRPGSACAASLLSRSPVRATTTQPSERAVWAACTTFGELPLVLIANSKSPWAAR